MGGNTETPTWVYRLHCEHGATLFVGTAVDLDSRIEQHRATKAWWWEVDAIQARLFSTSQEANEIVADIVRVLRPKHNIGGRLVPVPGVSAGAPMPFPTLAGRVFAIDPEGRPVCTDDWESR